MKKIKWDFQNEGDLTIELIRQHYEGQNVRISLWRSVPGNKNEGYSLESVWYVVKGECEITFVSGGIVHCPSDGRIIEAPRGRHTIKTIGKEELNIVKVFDLDSLL